MRKLFAICILFALASCKSSAPVEPLPELGLAPDFHLTNTKGESVDAKDLSGKVRVLNFFFSSCPTICPTINGYMSGIHKEFQKDGVLNLSLSVDPERDTPEKLAEYSKDYRVSDSNWLFLTQVNDGDSKVTDIIDTGFKLASGQTIDMHSTRIVLVDSKDRIRGFYRGLEPEQIEALRGDLKKLLQEEARG